MTPASARPKNLAHGISLTGGLVLIGLLVSGQFEAFHGPLLFSGIFVCRLVAEAGAGRAWRLRKDRPPGPASVPVAAAP